MENNYRGNMTIPKKLKEKRDELALGRAENFWGERDSLEQEEQNSFDDIVKDYKSGFNSACNLLLPEIEKLSKVLDTYTDIYTPGNDAAKEALQSLREFLGEESEGKNV